MKYALLSDIHGNLAAFKAALADAKKRGCAKVVRLVGIRGYVNPHWGIYETRIGGYMRLRCKLMQSKDALRRKCR